MKFLLAGLLLLSPKSYGFTVTAENLLGYTDDILRVQLSTPNCPEGLEGELEEAIDFWNAATQSHLRLEKGSNVTVSTTDIIAFNFAETILVGCSTNVAEVNGDPAGTLGVGVSQDIDNDDVLDKGFLIINVQDGAAASFQLATADTRALTMAHELGHVFGLGHSSEPGALMFFSTTSSKKRNLHQDDIDGIRHLYPQKELDGDYPLGCGMVSPGNFPPPGGANLLLLATLLGLPLILLQGLRRHA